MTVLLIFSILICFTVIGVAPRTLQKAEHFKQPATKLQTQNNTKVKSVNVDNVVWKKLDPIPRKDIQQYQDIQQHQEENISGTKDGHKQLSSKEQHISEDEENARSTTNWSESFHLKTESPHSTANLKLAFEFPGNDQTDESSPDEELSNFSDSDDDSGLLQNFELRNFSDRRNISGLLQNFELRDFSDNGNASILLQNFELSNSSDSDSTLQYFELGNFSESVLNVLDRTRDILGLQLLSEDNITESSEFSGMDLMSEETEIALFPDVSTVGFEFLIDSETTQNLLLAEMLSSVSLLNEDDHDLNASTDEFFEATDFSLPLEIESELNDFTNSTEDVQILETEETTLKEIKSENITDTMKMGTKAPECPDPGWCIFSFLAQDTCAVNSHCLGSRICCKSGCSKTCLDVPSGQAESEN